MEGLKEIRRLKGKVEKDESCTRMNGEIEKMEKEIGWKKEIKLQSDTEKD